MSDSLRRGQADYKKWRSTVRKRDGHKCTMPLPEGGFCGSKKNLEVHHIKPWKDHEELRFDVKNGVTLCQTHHIEVNGREEDFVETFSKYVQEKSSEPSAEMQMIMARYGILHGNS